MRQRKTTFKKKTKSWRKTAYSVTTLSSNAPKTQVAASGGRMKITLGSTVAKARKVARKVKPVNGETSSFNMDEPMRLQKVLAHVGIASRRKSERLILEGMVTVNGATVTELGTKVVPSKDKIKVDGKMLMTDVDPLYIALYKPKGVISSLFDPEGRPTLTDLIKRIRGRVVPIGRMDYNSEGLILMTNDGDLANKILKSRSLPKLYMIKTKGHPTDSALQFLKQGMFTAGGVVRFASYGVEQSLKSKSWIKIEVVEGSQLDLREIFNRKGLLVDRIVRTAIGPVSIQGLKPGEWRECHRQDFEDLLEYVKTQNS